jgi:HAMP domain-containing protein
VPIRMRFGATFFLTSLVPLAVLLTLTVGVWPRLLPFMSEPAAELWRRYVWAQVYVVLATGLASTVMALLVARFINRPIQALRGAMAAVEAGDLAVRVPIRSRDELGELGTRFNRMVEELREAAEARQLFGRYVSPEVARRALERGVELGGEVVQATAMFADLRGFTARTQQLGAADVVTLLATYYETVERVCHEEQGILTQFLGDGVVVVFGSPLLPIDDHARRAVTAARRILHELGARCGPDGAPLRAAHLYDRRRRGEPGGTPAGEDARGGGGDPRDRIHARGAAAGRGRGAALRRPHGAPGDRPGGRGVGRGRRRQLVVK